MQNATAPVTAPATLLPTLFIGHGNPMHAIDDNPFKLEWQAWGQRLRANYPAPRAILIISAHWLSDGWQITTAAQPRTIHDFGGFPAELFAQQYPAPGSPAIAAEIMQALPQLNIQSDGGQWGLDHGAWTVLMHLFPQADIPVLQLSLNAHASLTEHYHAGQALAVLRQRGILIIGSGNTIHNFGLIRVPRQHPLWQQAFAFDASVAAAIESRQHTALHSFADQASAQLLRNAHPSLEHYAPLLYPAAASLADERISQFLDGDYPQAPVGMRCVQWA
jgi:4,5-DOPA dioxygenase extradiol